ncbi:MAG: hypothetical protein ACREEM_13825 [Blastocatellia bacterium]
MHEFGLLWLFEPQMTNDKSKMANAPDARTLLQTKRLNDEGRGCKEGKRGKKKARFLLFLPLLPFLQPFASILDLLDMPKVSRHQHMPPKILSRLFI